MSKASEYSKRKSGENAVVSAPATINAGTVSTKTKNKAQLYSEKKRITGKIILLQTETQPTTKDIADYQKLTLQEKRMTEQERKEQRQAEQTQYWYDYDVDAAQKELDALEYSPTPLISAEWWKGVKDQYLNAINSTEESTADREKQARISQLSQEINTAKKYQQAKQYYDLTQAEDFAEVSADTRYKGTNEYDAVFGRDPYSADDLNASHRAEYDAIVSQYGEGSEEAEDYLLLHLGNGVNPIAKNMQEITDEEKSLYNYILIKQGKDAAQAYIDYLQDSLNERHAVSTYENLQKNREKYGSTYAALDNIADVGYSFGTGMKSGVQGMSKFFTDEALPVSDSEYLQSMMREDAGFVKGIAMDAASSVGNMMPSIGLSLINPVVGKVAFGVSAAGNAKQEALRQGYTARQATDCGILVGASEVVLEKVLGGIPGLSSGTVGKATAEGVGKIGKVLFKLSPKMETIFRTVSNFTGEMLGEAEEEWLQEILDPVFRNICFGENNEIQPFSEEALYSAMLGAITSGVMNASSVGKFYEDAVDATAANRVLVASKNYTGDAAVKARENLAEKVNDGTFERSDVEAVILAAVKEELQIQDAGSATAEGSPAAPAAEAQQVQQAQQEQRVQSADDPYASVRSHLSEDGRIALDAAIKHAGDATPSAVAATVEQQYLKGFTGAEYQRSANFMADAIQRAAYDAGVEARANLGKVTVAEGITVSDEFRTMLARVAKDLHTHITYGGTAPTRNGVTERGYSTKYGELHIYADAKVKGANGTTLYGERAAAVIIAGHELTHRLQQLAPREYTAFRDYAVEQLGGKEAVATYMREHNLDGTDAMDEITANYAMEKLFYDEKTIAQITKKHSKLAQAIRDILAWIKEKLHLSSDIDRAIRLWNDAYNAASRNAKNPQVHNDIAQSQAGAKQSRNSNLDEQGKVKYNSSI